MLAQPQTRLPIGDMWRYEPKLDCFRGLLWHRTVTAVQLLSRNGRDLAPWFPELVRAGQTLPVGTLIDGEIVVADDDGSVAFSALQTRLSSARQHASRIALERPAVLVTFDVLENRRVEIRGGAAERTPRTARACWRIGIPACSWSSRLPTPSSPRIGSDRFLPSIEGVVAKRAGRGYAHGRGRAWLKIKRYRTVDCLVIGAAGDLDTPKLVLCPTHPDGTAHHLGVTRTLPPTAVGPLNHRSTNSARRKPRSVRAGNTMRCRLAT
jgi:hypothetical protein